MLNDLVKKKEKKKVNVDISGVMCFADKLMHVPSSPKKQLSTHSLKIKNKARRYDETSLWHVILQPFASNNNKTYDTMYSNQSV